MTHKITFSTPKPPKDTRKVQAVLYQGGLYIKQDRYVYRYASFRSPSAGTPTGFPTLQSVLDTRGGSVALYKGDTLDMTVEF